MLLWNTEQQVEVLVTSTAGFCRGDEEMEDGGRFDVVLQKDSGRWMGGDVFLPTINWILEPLENPVRRRVEENVWHNCFCGVGLRM